MNKHLLAALKIFYIAISILLFVLPVFVPSSHSAYNLVNLCLLGAVLLSLPLSYVALAVLGLCGLFPANAIGELYLYIFLCCLIGYFQWFVFAPRLFKSVFRKMRFADFHVCLKTGSSAAKSLNAADETRFINERQPPFYDERQRTPVERLFDKSDD